MNKIRNHTIGASLTAVAMIAVITLTGCGTEQDEDCREDESMSSMSMVDGRAGGSSGGGSSRGGSSSGGSRVSRPNMNKPAQPVKTAKPVTGSSSTGGSGSKAKAPKIHIDDEDCD